MTVLAWTTGSREGNARAPGALTRLLKIKDLSPLFACADQVHGSRIRIVPALRQSIKYPRTDGLLTEAAGVPLAIFTADCVPVFLSADGGRVVGLLHAGWRGVRSGILKKAVRILWSRWRIPSSRVQVWAGPSIGRCCFEVHWDVARYFPASRRGLVPRSLGEGGWTVDLAGELKRQAARLGARWNAKKSFAGCTMHGKRYFSYRRDKTEKRQVSVIAKTGRPKHHL